MLKVLLTIFIAFPVYATASCTSEFYKAYSKKKNISTSEITSFYNNCPFDEQEELREAIELSGNSAKYNGNYEVMSNFLENNFGYNSKKAFETYEKYENTYDSDEIIHNMEEIVEYAPRIFDHLIYEFEPSETVELAKSITLMSNEKNKEYILSRILAHNLDSSQEIQQQLKTYGANFKNGKKNIENLCEFVDEKIQNQMEFLSDDYYDMSSSEVLIELISITDDYFDNVSKFVNLEEVVCDGQTLLEYKEEVQTADYWNLEDIYGPLDQEILHAQSKDQYYFQLKTPITMKGINVLAVIKMSRACSKRNDSKNRLYSILHNEIIRMKQNSLITKDMHYINYQTRGSCLIGITLRILNQKGLSLDQVLKIIY